MNTKNKRKIVLIIVDILSVIIATAVALAMRFDLFDVPQEYMLIALKALPIDICITVGVLWFFKLYDRIWTFASINEIVKTAEASLLITLIVIAYRMLYVPLHTFRSFYILFGLVLFVLLCGSRLSIRILRYYKRELTQDRSAKKIMIVGAGSAGAVLITEIGRTPGAGQISCIIDDNKNKKGQYIQGVQIVGNRNDIASAVGKYDIGEIIIALPSASTEDIREIVTICNQTSCAVKILPAITKTLTGSLSDKVRDINYEDLLGRNAIVVKNPHLEEFITGKTIMVTGGGGTIGSELCRQIMANNPGKLLIVDIYENGAYELQMELIQEYGSDRIEVLIASVRDYDRLESIFREYQPEVIYHAAAHKHVPLMEYSPNEAIKNNCKGTLNLSKLADEYGVKRFVLISTDKAVRPTNVMGATKRICEMIVQTYARRSKTEFVAVRFGNVLGSNGSVIPLFLKQIEKGGPVTLTHREITRFFMTVKEAVSLVLQAGLLARGGEIFVLDMGQPVKIYDLAVNLIKMKGYIPEEDIKIKIVGLRPGEKLYEELLMAEEGLQNTSNKLIFVGQPIELDSEQFLKQLDDLIEVAETNGSQIKEHIKGICDTYSPQ